MRSGRPVGQERHALGEGGVGVKKFLFGGVAGLIVVIGIGGGGWWYLHRSASAKPVIMEKPVSPPIFLKLAPVVATLDGKSGRNQFVEVGMTLRVWNKKAKKAIETVLPEIRNAAIQLILARTPTELKTAKGVQVFGSAVRRAVNAFVPPSAGTAGSATDWPPKKGPVAAVFVSRVIVE